MYVNNVSWENINSLYVNGRDAEAYTCIVEKKNSQQNATISTVLQWASRLLKNYDIILCRRDKLSD